MPNLSKTELTKQLEQAKQDGHDQGVLDGYYTAKNSVNNKKISAQIELIKVAGQAINAIAESLKMGLGYK